MTAAAIAELLHGRPSGAGWVARCPAHEDRNPSLSITEREDKTLLHCHAGCTTEAVCTAAGLELRDLFLDTQASPRIVKEYNYTDESGALLYQVVRSEPKDFRQRRPDGNGGWTWSLNGTKRVAFNLPEVIKAKTVLVCEGEKDCETARGLGLTATCNPGGAGKWRPEYSEYLTGKKVVIIADADEPGRKHAQQVAASLHGKAEAIKVLEMSGASGAKDLSEWAERGGTRLALVELIRDAPAWQPEPAKLSPRLIAVSVGELLTKTIKPREMLLAPILPEQGLAMLYSYRGIGKTFVGLGVGIAVAAGAQFLRWTAPRPRRVLYVDGEMPGKAMQERTAMILAGLDGKEPSADALRIITPDLQERPMPDLATADGQALLEPHLEGVDLVILDNLSSLCRNGNENEGEGWLPVQEWALRLRREGKTVLFIHHSGKNKSQRGTSRREDLLDTVVTLKHPADYNPSEGMRCEVHFEKGRGLFGDGAKPFEIRLDVGPDGRAIWTHRDLDAAKANQADELFGIGMSVRDVAEELGISKGAAQRLRAKWKRGDLGGVPLAAPIRFGTAVQGDANGA